MLPNPDAILPSTFSRLLPGSFQVISDPNNAYNCIAWAVGDTNRRWWPTSDPLWYWPDGIALEATLEAFIEMFARLGYSLCDNPDLEPSFEKIAIYRLGGSVTHAAKQLPTGRWTSKLGDWWLIEHDFDALTGSGPYGEIAQVMKRPTSNLPPH